jgi:hypothetical protein
MTSPIDPIRRAAALRRTRHSAVDPSEPAHDADDRYLPVPVEPRARTVPPSAQPSPKADAVFAAQLLGQDGQKRGLRAGPTVIDTAKATYNRTEYSGRHDRRARKGRAAKTEV